MNPMVEPDAAEVFFDGLTTAPRLDHPEGLAVHADGSIWCGGEGGQIYRIDPDGRSIEKLADSGGFSQGIAFDREGNLYVCDLEHAAVMRLDAERGVYERFADGADGQRIRIANYPAFGPDGSLYVSDSHAFKNPGPGIFRFWPDGSGELWYGEPVNFANGLAFSSDGRFLYVAETFGHAIFRLPLKNDGSAGPRQEVVELPGVLPDGLAFDRRGNLYVACYEPSQVLRVAHDGAVEILVRDEEAHLLCHPTNVAFRGSTLFAANLGRWHITRISADTEGLPLYAGYGA